MTGPPILDVAPLLDGGADAASPALLRDLDAACREWGFFQIVGHGSTELRLAAFDRSMREFFALQQSEKDAVCRSADNARGYYERELTKNTRDWKEIFDFGHKPRLDLPDEHPENRCLDGWNQWPARPTDFATIAKRQYTDCERIAGPLLSAICVALGAPADALRDAFVGHSSFLRLNHYPPCEDPASPDAPAVPSGGQLGVNRHTDAGALTLLYQDDVASLQVEHDGAWVLVEPQAGALVVNIGDMLQVWSNDRYPAPLHRVLAQSVRDRVSAPFFYNPSYDSWAEPLACSLASGRPAAYRPVSWAEFRGRRAAGDYTDLGEEVQVSHYRVAG